MDKPYFEMPDLDGPAGNVYVIVGMVSKTLKSYGLPELAKEFSDKAFKSSSYDEVLDSIHDYCEVV